MKPTENCSNKWNSRSCEKYILTGEQKVKKKIERNITSLFLLLVILLSIMSTVTAQPVSPPQSSTPKEMPFKTGTVSGRFVVKDEIPAAVGQILFYSAEPGQSPRLSQFMRVPDLIVDTDYDGYFFAELPEGEYYLTAIKRNSGKMLGKPEKGDHYFRLRKEHSEELEILSVTEGNQIFLGNLAAVPWGNKKINTPQGRTVIKGTLLDVEGKPVEHGIIFAFSTPQMQGSRPEFVSSQTGKEGKYILKIAGGHTYYLMARDVLGGGQLAEGAIIGIYGDKAPSAVKIASGETIEGLDIVVTRMMRRVSSTGIGVEEKGQNMRNPAPPSSIEPE